MDDRPAVGVDAGGTKIAAGLVDRNGRVLTEHRLRTPKGPAGDTAVTLAVLDALATAIEAAVAAAGGGVAGVGVGLPGLLDRAAGRFLYGPNFPLRDIDVVAALEKRIHAAVVIESDANAAAWAEHRFGAGRGCADLLMVTLGTGIGGGVISGGRLWRGGHGHAGEFGHMTVDPSGPPCACGARGHWESFASGTALDRLAREAAAGSGGDALLHAAGTGRPDDVSGAHATAAAAAGDPVAAEVLDRFAARVAGGLAGLVQCFDPARIVVGGGVVVAGPALFEPLAAHLAEALTGQAHRSPVDVVPAQLGPSAGIVGAATLARV